MTALRVALIVLCLASCASAATRRQIAEGTIADPSVATWPSGAPNNGSLLLASCAERSGTGHTAHTISGWTKITGVNGTGTPTNTYRRSMSLWYKVASSEGTTVSCDDATTNNKHVYAMEFEPGGGETFTLLESATNQNAGVSDATSISTGTTASVADQALLVVGFVGYKENASSWDTPLSWTNSLASADETITAGQPVQLGSAFKTTATGGTFESTASWTSGSNNGLLAGIAVFDLDGGAPPATPCTLLLLGAGCEW